MASHEKIERVRQQIMRFQELLELTRHQLEQSQQAYDALFDHCATADRQTLPIKQQQWKIAEQIVDDPAELRDAVLNTHFNLREMKKAFSELHDLIIQTQEEEPAT